MEKRKNDQGLDNNQLLLLGALGLIVLFGAGGLIGGLFELVFGIIGVIIGLVVGLVGTVIGIVFGLIGAVLGIAGAVIGIVVGTAAIWIPLLIIVAIVKAVSGNDEKPKQKRTIDV